MGRFVAVVEECETALEDYFQGEGDVVRAVPIAFVGEHPPESRVGRVNRNSIKACGRIKRWPNVSAKSEGERRLRVRWGQPSEEINQSLLYHVTAL